MGYDQNVASSVLSLDLKRRLWRVDFERPQSEDNNSLYANCFLREDVINATEGNPKSGSVVSSENWLLTINRAQIMNFSSSGVFFNSMIKYLNGLKSEWDSTGTISTGSVSQIP